MIPLDDVAAPIGAMFLFFCCILNVCVKLLSANLTIE
uniref:Uncharacterized protein n=1 Tax=Rhizophora mucronata TaxID=61149 RepID=A0A2P2ND71_RHIMU